MKYRLLVIGAGLSGLTTAYTLAKNGHDVTVLFKDSCGIVSQVAAACWVLPEAKKLQEWAMCSYHKFTELAKKDNATGVIIKDFHFVFNTKILDSPKYSSFMENHKNIPGFRHSRDILREKGINGAGLVDCFTYQSPFVDTDVYLKWLTKQCQSRGVRFQKGSITGLLADQIDSLKKEFLVDLVVNCTGLGAKELAGDEDVFPGVGAAFLFQKSDKSLLDFGINCQVVWVDEEFHAYGHFIMIPRNEDGLYWIGTLNAGNTDTKQLHAHHPIVQRMLDECISIYPKLKDIIAGQQITLLVGSRPMRKGGPRVEQDDQCQSIIHNYGHSAYGCILSWGSAEEVLRVVEHTGFMKTAKL